MQSRPIRRPRHNRIGAFGPPSLEKDMFTIVVILALAALIMGICAAAGKGGPLMLPVAVILLSIALLIQRIPIG